MLVRSLHDRGFLFLLSSAQMVESKGTEKLFVSFSRRPNTYLLPRAKFRLFGGEKKKGSFCFPERRGRLEKSLQALFIFQESRTVVKYRKCDWLPFPLTYSAVGLASVVFRGIFSPFSASSS